MSEGPHRIELETEQLTGAPAQAARAEETARIMCAPGQIPAVPATAAQAVAMATAGLGWLAQADATTLTAVEQADALRGLERLQSMHTAAQAKVLKAFAAGSGPAADGHPTGRSWLRWQTRLTRSAAAGAVGWMRRLAAHPAVARALADGVLSQSWARELCRWSDLLPEAVRGDADVLLLAAAAAGLELADLARLAQEIRSRTATPDTGGDDGFTDRYLSLATTIGGAGVLRGELTPQCAAALQTLLDSLGKRHGPEDTRTKGQRFHDALEEICRRLIAAGGLPGRAGQPVQIQLHMTLDQLRGLPGADTTQAAWAGTLAGPGADCDATIIPSVCGHLDPALATKLTSELISQLTSQDTAHDHDSQQDPGTGGSRHDPGTGDQTGQPSHCAYPGGTDPGTSRRQRTERAVRQMLIRHAADLLSGPAGLAAILRTGLSDRLAATVSLPLDVGAAAETIPAHLRRAVTTRDRHCRFPGCHQPPAACQPHHIIPRAQGGPTSLTNMTLLCSFHHLIAVHRWGWAITLQPDGTLTATSPDHTRIHGPPLQAA
jgi:Domain of unknown function (DUF222)/HNH endonuclease